MAFEQQVAVPSTSGAPVELQASLRPLRFVELLLVTSVAFAAAILMSLYALLVGDFTYDARETQFLVYYGLLYECIALAVLGYVLYRQGRGLSDIGLSFSWADVPVSILLSIVGYIAYYLCYVGIYFGYYAVVGQPLPQQEQPETYLDAGLTIGTVLFVLINPVYEELIARAYTMSEVKALTGSSAIAISVSTALQISYHLYQGIPAALALGAMFFVLSFYFARSGRIMPVILTHLYFDAMALAAYA